MFMPLILRHSPHYSYVTDTQTFGMLTSQDVVSSNWLGIYIYGLESSKIRAKACFSLFFEWGKSHLFVDRPFCWFFKDGKFFCLWISWPLNTCRFSKKRMPFNFPKKVYLWKMGTSGMIYFSFNRWISSICSGSFPTKPHGTCVSSSKNFSKRPILGWTAGLAGGNGPPAPERWRGWVCFTAAMVAFCLFS